MGKSLKEIYKEEEYDINILSKLYFDIEMSLGCPCIKKHYCIHGLISKKQIGLYCDTECDVTLIWREMKDKILKIANKYIYGEIYG